MAKKSLPYRTRDLKFCIKEDSWIAWFASKKLRSSQVAITIGKAIHLWNTTAIEFLQSKSWVNHELCHIQQFRKHGFLKFILIYLSESVQTGYFKNRFEVEARNAERSTEEITIHHGA